MEIIKIENLSFVHENSERFALENIDLSVKKGEIVTIFGKSGSGKSTLVKMLLPNITPNGQIFGNIKVFGKNLSDFDNKDIVQKIGFVSQSPENQIVTDKVWSELAFGLENIGTDQNEITIRIAEICNYFGINSWINKSTFELSGGQKQLLNLASIMCLQPEILVFDEPLSQLDPIACQKFIDIINKINRDFGTTIVIVEHNLEYLIELCNNFHFVNCGKVEFSGDLVYISDKIYSENEYLSKLLPFYPRVSNEVFNLGKSEINRAKLIEKLESELPLHENDLSVCTDLCDEKSDILKMKEVFYKYDKNSDFILKDLTFDICKNEILSIVGANGSGKSTILKLIAGIIDPSEGKMVKKSDFSIGYLPQDPTNLFSCETVLEEISEFYDTENEVKIEDIIKICNLSGILSLHPYDISGGEQQKVALAKILMRNPNFFLFDEPTKGMDSIFKHEFAEILRKLKTNDTSIVMVTHDLDFSAEISDKCAMVFDGKIISCMNSTEFYSKNSFYTTSTRKFVKNYLDKVVTLTQLKNYFGIEAKKDKINKDTSEKNFHMNVDRKPVKNDKKYQINIYLIISILILMPVTIFAGNLFFDNRRYYFISILLIIETFLPLLIQFEKKHSNTKEIAIISSFCSLIVASRAVFYAFPQFKPMLALVAISGVSFGSQTGFLVGSLSMFLSNFIFGQGPWTPWQIFAMCIIGAVFGTFYHEKKHNKLILSVFGAFSAIFIYGLILNISTVLISQANPTFDMFKTTIILGFPMDLIHAISTFLFMYFGFDFIMKKIQRIKVKYDVFNR